MVYLNNLGTHKYRARGKLAALDGTVFGGVDVQSPACKLLLGDLPAKQAYENEELLKENFERIVFQPQAGEAAGPEQAGQYIANFSPVTRNNRWYVRCGTMDYVDCPIETAAAGQTSLSLGAVSSSAKKSK